MDGAPGQQPEHSKTGARSAPVYVGVWDSAVRIFHWSLVAAVTTAWLTGGTGSRAHEIAGCIVVGLLVFRLGWGFVGTRHARFSDFVRSPFAVLRYLRDLGSGRDKRHMGHNPAGGAMIVALLVLLTVISVTGIMQLTNRFFGEAWVENLHHYAANVLLILVPLHVLGVVVSSLLHRENLVRAMISGTKRQEKPIAETPERREARIFDRIKTGEGLLVLLLAMIGGAAWGVIETGRREVRVTVDEKQPIVELGPSLEVTVATRMAIERAPGKDRLDYVASAPLDASRAWLVSSGGRLYDNWFVALGVKRPATTHPAWPEENNNLSGAETWRCKSCHGWDYLGRGGQNKAGPSATGIAGVQNAKGRPPELIAGILSNSRHGFTDELMPPDVKFRLALFLSLGQHTVRNYIRPDNTVNGNPVQGRAIYENVCAACHGFDGKARRLGISSDPAYKGVPLFVGSKATANPTEVLHKIRNGHPGAIMVSLRSFPIEYAVNVLAYAQTLPTQ